MQNTTNLAGSKLFSQGLIFVVLGVLWGAANQLIPPLLRLIDLHISFNVLVYTVWPLALLALLLLVARQAGALAWGMLGACFAGGVVLGWFGLYAALVQLGLVPQVEQMYSGLDLAGAWLGQTASLFVSPWLFAALVAGFALGLVSSGARRFVFDPR